MAHLGEFRQRWPGLLERLITRRLPLERFHEAFQEGREEIKTVIEIVTHSSVYGKFSAESVITLIVILVAGPVIYLIASSVRKQRNQLDISMAMRELPPE